MASAKWLRLNGSWIVNDMAKNLILWIVIALVLMSVFNNFGPRGGVTEPVDYSQFMANVQAGRVQHVVIEGKRIQGRLTAGETFTTYSPETDNRSMVGDLLERGVRIKAQPPEQQSVFMQIFISWFPMLLLIGVWIFFMRQMQGGGGGRGAMSFGKSRARLLGEDQVKVTFSDVAGVDEAKCPNWSNFYATPESIKSLGERSRAVC
ncbi:MAG: cell division protease FtsH [Gammaproteobacteria bacterium]